MKLKKIIIENVKSFKERTEINFNENLNIFIGPNRGGKSNLLDIISITLRHFFIKFYRVNKIQEQRRWFEDINTQNIFHPINNFLEKYFGNDQKDLIIEITFTLGKEDIDNIRLLKENKEKLENVLFHKYRDKPINSLNFINLWNPELFSQGIPENIELTYKIHNYSLEPPTNDLEKIFLQYLNFYELFNIITTKVENLYLNPLFLYFPPYRILTQTNLIANLSGQNFYDLVLKYIQSTSKNTASLIDISTYYFGEKLRKYENQGGNYYEKFKQDYEVALVTKYLNRMGYGWKLECVDLNRNMYEINLERNGRRFSINQASSGEKEILNFLLGIFAFNIKNGLIIIDEPDLHLHPKWQITLVDLFQELSSVNNNQFLIVTHSPTFINEKTIENVFRVYMDNEISKVIQPERDSLPKIKDLLHIVNTFNNEKIFFADKVVLVEGIGDRLIFQRLIKKYQENDQEIVEILEVHGKQNLSKYRDFLNLFGIKNYIIADLDYVSDIGDRNIKKIFVVNYAKIDEDVLLNKKSKDGKCLARFLKETIDNIEYLDKKQIENLKSLWRYIESRYKKLKDNMSDEENRLLDEFIESKKTEGIYILKYGEIEDYFPQLSKNRSFESLVEFVTSENFNKWLQEIEGDDKRKDLDSILFEILEIEDNKATNKQNDK